MKSAAWVVWLVATSTLSGCLVGQRSPEKDTDGDFLPDSFEEEGWTLSVQDRVRECFDAGAAPPANETHVTSSPIEGDTDFDGVDDAKELQWGSDPRANDTDRDGLTDRAEIELNEKRRDGLRGVLKPNVADTDGDCLSDGQEIHGIEIPGLGLRTSDPTVNDTDGDGLKDAEEALRMHTDPGRFDTDGDGAGDAVDADPRNDVAIRFSFERILLKAGGGTVPVVFQYTFTARPGIVRPTAPTALNVSVGQNTTVPATHSPNGTVNVEDASISSAIGFEFWVARDDTGAVIDLTGNASDTIVRMAVDVQTRTWSHQEGARGDATGNASYLATSAAELEFRLAVEHR